MVKVTADVEVSWSRLTTWLAQHAPVSFAALRPPASGPDPALPADLRRLLLINDGADSSEHTQATFLPGMFRPLPADQIAASNAMHIEILADHDGDDMIGHWWHPKWITLGSDGLGNALVIDDRPGPERGKVWEWSKYDGLIWEFAPSLGEFLAGVAAALEGGSPLLGWRAQMEDGDLEWTPE